MLSFPPEWMQWTLPTVLFLGFIAAMLVGLTLWDIKDPGWARQGLLPIDTTRGDRVFMGLLLTGCTFCLWMLFFSQTAVWGVLLVGAVLVAGSISFL
jgi:predicted small integral membrane protein